MLIEGRLLRTAEKLSNYINEYVTVAGVEKKEEVVQLFDNILKVFPNWVIMTCPVMSSEMNFVSNNCEQVFGHKQEFFTLHTRLESLFYHVHDDDQDDLFNCVNFVHDYLQSIPPEFHHQYRAIYHYRFKKPGTQSIYLHDEKAVLSLRGSGNLYYGLFRDISSEKSFSGVKVELFKQNETVTRIREYKPSAERGMLTKREGEIVDLIKQGYSTKEMAWRLNISHNTVRNIKSKMFEKYQVNNTIELLNMTA